MTYSTEAPASSAVSKVIQIAAGSDGRLYALTEDGEIWLYGGLIDPGWEQLPPPAERPPREFVFLDRQENA